LEAFARVAADGGYRGERGRGGFLRADWDEAVELIAAAGARAAGFALLVVPARPVGGLLADRFGAQRVLRA
jgi:anaerobic selenocysteine-containing dehydrogenase